MKVKKLINYLTILSQSAHTSDDRRLAAEALVEVEEKVKLNIISCNTKLKRVPNESV